MEDAGAGSAAGSGDEHGHRGAHRRRSGLPALPLRTGLYGASAAVAVGAVAMASGLLPGPGGPPAGDRGARVQAGTPGSSPAPGVPSSLPSSGPRSAGAGGGAGHHGGGSFGDASQGRGQHSAGQRGDGRTPGSAGSAQGRIPGADSSGRADGADTEGAGDAKSGPAHGSSDVASSSAESRAERRVLALVNRERDRAGCKPVTADRRLGGLARDFSEEMDREDFFGHTTPDGDSPWERARQAGISGLGGENIARGQADARSVMRGWMHSPGHRANILNCQYRTLGVGAHFGPGGPWWTQDFGY